MSIVFAIILFSFLIFVHEFGHFVTAKLSGVRVNEFSMFMGPAIWKKQKGETLYAIRCIPIGGYCAMEGENDDSEDPRSFGKAPWWKRLIILVAGSAMNFIAALLIFAVIYMPMDTIAKPVITEFTDCCTFNNEQGLQLGDEILSIDGEKVYINNDISLLLSLNSTGVHDLQIRRDGEKIEIEDLNMAHKCVDAEGNEYIHYGIAFGQVQEADIFDKLGYVWNLTIDNARNTRLSLQMLFTGQAKVSEMTGVVGIVDMMSDVADASETWMDALLNMLNFGGFIAVNLAVMNLLPIPALDGGRVVGLLISTGYETITRKKLNPKIEGYVHGIGMVLLLILMAVIMFKDIFTIFKG